ncbi:MAG TPA: helix-turn-helix domain-containing protein [Aliidongia sp.]|uniref:IclR family transcriptional regulator n=1 Tax=Aliidongia sp. TaxID=1914230 RepID=UPI002DDD422F|nr:helix-turn-helix domain-containing protein [Aliidongia sp.]HEV2674787.1 helix-turn-helix domain-containing protein [Aliidongia sp.]
MSGLETFSAPARKAQGVNAAERALAVLDAFIGDGSRGLADLAKTTELAKPTVLRLLVSLERSGYVVRLNDGRYQLGAKLMQLGATYRDNFRLDQHVLPVLDQLAAATRESVAFHIREGDSRLRLFRVESPQAVRDVPKPAVLIPLDATSTGHVLRTADWPVVGRDGRVAVYASSGVYDAQTASAATAVFAAGPVLAGALTVSGPVGRFGTAQVRDIAGHLVLAAHGLSMALGAPAGEPGVPRVTKV